MRNARRNMVDVVHLAGNLFSLASKSIVSPELSLEIAVCHLLSPLAHRPTVPHRASLSFSFSPFLFPAAVDEIIPGRLHISVTGMTLSASSGQMCWCLCTLGLRAFGQPELVFLLKSVPDVR